MSIQQACRVLTGFENNSRWPDPPTLNGAVGRTRTPACSCYAVPNNIQTNSEAEAETKVPRFPVPVLEYTCPRVVLEYGMDTDTRALRIAMDWID